MEQELIERLARIDQRQLHFQSSHNQLHAELHAVRKEQAEASASLLEKIAEIRQAVGLSMPPAGAAVRAAQWHASAAVRYGLIAASGAAGAWVMEQLGKVFQ